MEILQKFDKMKIGFIGLGKMGSRMALKLLEEGHSVVAWNRSQDAIASIKDQISYPKDDQSLAEKLKISATIKDLVGNLEKPRIVWIMLPAGDITEEKLQEVAGLLDKGDIVIDGGNSNFKDTERRFEMFQKKGMRFLGIGVSGGIKAFENGYPLMVGGDKSAYENIKPILKSLAAPHGGYDYFGTGGAGHFVKMVHNGIEYGMMQAIGEGFGVLEKSQYSLDLVSVSKLWQKGTIIESFLMECTRSALEKDSNLSGIIGEINATGEAAWTVEIGKKERVPVPVIEASLDFRAKSHTEADVRSSFAARLVAALRQEFGGHEVVKK